MADASDERFAVLTAARRVWAVAAVHGEAARLEALQEAVGERFERGDRLVYLGNYLGRGEHICATLDALVRFRRLILTLPGMESEDIVYLRGAQEEMWHKLLQLQFAVGPSEVFDWMMTQGVAATLMAYGGNADAARSRFREGALATTRWTSEIRAAMHSHPGHDDLLYALRRAAYTEGGELLFLHAAIDPGRLLTEQGDTLWWGSGYFADIAEPYAGFRRVVRGYDRLHRGPAETAFTASIDAGAGFGGPLMAACFDLEGTRVDAIEV